MREPLEKKTQISVIKKLTHLLIKPQDPIERYNSQIRDRLFQRGVSTRGGGLGLYLTRQIVQAKKGTTEVADFEQGKGATFIIRLPLVF
jgi:sensor histidine kinase regulating citrate/malate metabolism